MPKKAILTLILAIAGTALVWFPLLAPVVLAAARIPAGRPFRLDWLMPAELFPVVLAGGGLLTWAALRARSYRGLIAGAFGAAVALLLGGQLLAVVTGLASGATEPTGWRWILVCVSIGAYGLALVAIGVGGVLLVRQLLKAPRPPK